MHIVEQRYTWLSAVQRALPFAHITRRKPLQRPGLTLVAAEMINAGNGTDTNDH